MLLRRWEPFAGTGLRRFQDEMNRLFETLGVEETPWPAYAVAFPPMNVWEDENCFYAETELPGMTQEDVQIFVTEGNQLTIQGERKPLDEAKSTWHRQERSFGKFSRTITLPVSVDVEKVEARFENGLLTLTLPKAEAVKPRRIAVKAE